ATGEIRPRVAERRAEKDAAWQDVLGDPFRRGMLEKNEPACPTGEAEAQRHEPASDVAPAPQRCDAQRERDGPEREERDRGEGAHSMPRTIRGRRGEGAR